MPKLRVLDEDEKNIVIKKYNIDNPNKFPIFNRNDAQAKFCGVRSNTLCEITRDSETAGIYISYRYMP